MRRRILLIEDDQALREMTSMALTKEGYDVTAAASASEAVRVLADGSFDLVLSDIYLGDATALDLLDTIERTSPQARVILVTGHGTVETAAAAHRAGVFDYLPKSTSLDDVLERVRDALAPAGRAAVPADEGPESMIVGSDPAIVAVYKAVARVAALPIPILLTGETGTGKELVARALHRFGARPEGPFVALNCGAIPEALLESELFGHRRGAFTGAVRDHAGAVTAAAGGTLLLDEVGELPLSLQVKLLRFLQEGEVRPVGGDHPTPADTRVVAATHRELRREVAGGRFREDLFYRLAGYEIELPPLRRRPADIPALVEHFRRRTAERLGRPPVAPPDAAATAVLQAHPWPGNVRELENLVQRAVIDLGTLADASALRELLERSPLAREASGDGTPAAGDDVTLDELQRSHIAAVLERCGGNRSRAARVLGIPRKTLYRKARRLGVELGPVTDEEAAP